MPAPLFGAGGAAAAKRFAAVEVLDLSHNALTGALPGALGDACAALRRLDVSHNRLTGALPRSLKRLRHLEYFKALGNRMLSDPFGVVVALRRDGCEAGYDM